jgi:chloride channel protein, CIC family
LKKIKEFLLVLQRKYIDKRTYLILASILVGIVTSLAAIGLKLFVRFMHRIPDYFLTTTHTHIWYLILPMSGIILTVLIVKFFFHGKLERGLGFILSTIVRKSSKVEKENMYTHIVTSGVTIGLGGSAGLEAPIVITGSAIGSNIATRLGFGHNERSLLLACGAASGIATVFNSPIAGVIFAIEVLLTDISIPLFIPLLISTATATIVSKLLYTGQLFYLISNQWYYHAIPFYILLGILCGLISVYMTRVTLQVEGYFDRKRKIWPKAVWGGLSLGLLIFFFPPLFGEGYVTVESLFRGDYAAILKNSLFTFLPASPWVLIVMVAVMILLKAMATALTLGSGGNGGIFAPSLFTGALTGFGTAFLVNTTGITTLHVSNFIAVGMAGVMAGVIHAPLTAIFLIAEITGGYMLFVPLMIVAALSYFISRYFEPYSVYTKNLIQKGHMYTSDKDRSILSQLNLFEMIDTEFTPVRIDDTFTSLIDAFTKSRRNVFPVVDHDNNFIGIIPLENIKEIMFQPELYEKMNIPDVTSRNVVTIRKDESMESAIEKFERSNLWNIPVIDGTRYAGFISRANLLSNYRRILKKSSTFF